MPDPINIPIRVNRRTTMRDCNQDLHTIELEGTIPAGMGTQEYIRDIIKTFRIYIKEEQALADEEAKAIQQKEKAERESATPMPPLAPIQGEQPSEQAKPAQAPPSPEPAPPEEGDSSQAQRSTLQRAYDEALDGEHPERIKIIDDKFKEFGVAFFKQLSKVQASDILTACGIRGKGR